MKRLISEKEINEECGDQGNPYNAGFESGVIFAEEKLKDLAILFARHCHTIGYVNQKYINSDLFERFIDRYTK